LYVSTIEPRKNHAFLFNVWHRLLEEHGSSVVPQLVFVGRRGHLVDDLFQQFENTFYLDSKVVVLPDVPDSLLSALYKECKLALYPSLAEGYGLPVAEAIVAGAICVASNKTSIPEVVGDIIDYFDPDDFNEAYRLIQRALFDDDYRANLRLRAQRFVPRPWSATAEDILQTIERHLPESTRKAFK
jgi:glycosyltransferase involved in cell wall biosynthesis